MSPEINIQKIQTEATSKTATSKMSEAELQKLRKTCADFESIFTYQLIKSMRQTIPKSQTGLGGLGKDNFTALMDQKLAETISSKGEGMGIQKVLYDQLTQAYKQSISKEELNKLK